MSIELNDIAELVYINATKNGFLKPLEDPHFHRLIAFTHSEVSELWEAVRKNKPKDKQLEEVADIIILALNLVVHLDLGDIEYAIREKMAKNNTRVDKHGKEF